MEVPASIPHVDTAPRMTAHFTFEVAVGLPKPEAIDLFTPEGERRWAPGWNPIYANVTEASRVGQGTVFTTDAHGGRRVWIVDTYDRAAGVVRYTVFHDESVTRIEVRVSPGHGGSTARVSYDRTSLNASADQEIAHFAAHAHAMQSEWQSAIDALPPR